MKRPILKQLADSLERIMIAKGMTAKELAATANISYPSLMPILNGNRDFGVTKLVAIMNALRCTSEDALVGLLPYCQQNAVGKPPEYLVSFVSLLSITYCLIYEVQSQTQKIIILQYISLACGQNPNEFVNQILVAVQRAIKEQFQKNISSKEIVIFIPIQKYELKLNRLKMQKAGNALFSRFIIESDIIVNHKAFFNNQNGICITINDNSAITSSLDNGQNIDKVQNYGFPIADIAGNMWIGCEAIKHAINVVEGVEASSLLSDKLLAIFDGRLNHILDGNKIEQVCCTASNVVKELLSEDQASRAIVKRSADLIMQKIRVIDKNFAIELPIALVGDLASIYKSFIPENRLITDNAKASDLILSYGLAVLLPIVQASALNT